MTVTNVSLETSKSQAIQTKSRYEYFSYDMKAWNRLQNVAANRSLVATALKVLLAVPAILADTVRNGAKLIGNGALSVANLAVGLYNTTQRALYGRNVQPLPKQQEVTAPVAEKPQEVVTTAPLTTTASSLQETQEDIIIGRVDITFYDDAATSSQIESEEEINEEGQQDVQSSMNFNWVATGKAVAAAVTVVGVSVAAYYGYQNSDVIREQGNKLLADGSKFVADSYTYVLRAVEATKTYFGAASQPLDPNVVT